jgi:lipopolysaccharide transport system ATP-binding protein
LLAFTATRSIHPLILASLTDGQLQLAGKMSEVVIRVENLGKKYRIRHQQAERYTALRDVIAGRFRRIFQSSPPALGPPALEDFWALKDVSFEVQRGEVIGIIGRNGAGKSTLLKILSRITEPTEGRVEIDGRVASLLEVGTGFHPELSGRENIYLNGTILGMSRAEIKRKFDEIVAFAEIEKFLDTPVKRYSSGMYVRLAFAVAAHLEPEILIVDEVLAVGDIEFQKKCLGRMDAIATKEGRTVLFVSHSMGSIQNLCRQGVLLEHGQIAYAGGIANTIANYLGRQQNKTQVKFQPREGQPSITAVTLDENELKAGNLIVDVEFMSPFQLAPPVPGIVISSSLGIPVYGSNPRFHNQNYPSQGLKAGVVRMEARELPLASGNYRLSIWLGDSHADYDHKADILSFDFRLEAAIALRPPNEVNGHLEWAANWRIL